MESHTNKTGTVMRYMAYIFLALGAFFIIRYFTKPKEIDTVAIKDMDMFMKSAIYETDQKLKTNSVEDDVASWISWYKSSTSLYNDAKTNKDQTIKEQSKVLKEHLLKLQVRDFPELRENYTNAKKEVLSQKNITIAASGAMHDTLTFTGNVFESSKQKRQFLKSIDQIAKDLRFKTVVFKWSDKASDISDYKVDAKGDSEI